MVIADLTYIKGLEKIEEYLEAHLQFLEKYYSAGVFICSGRKNPRTGGMIISNCSTVAEMENIIKEDPFYLNQLAEYKLTEVMLTKYAKNFEKYLGAIDDKN